MSRRRTADMRAAQPGAGTRRRRHAAMWAVLAIAVFALVFRILMIRQFGVPNPNADPLYYHAQANLIADGSGFAEPFTWLRNGTIIPSALHPPGFSLWLSIASVMGFRTVFSHQVMSAVAGTVLVLVVALVAGRLAGARAAVVAALLAALHPNLWVIDGTLMPESLYAMTIGFVLLAAYLYLARPSVWSAAAFGAVLAASALVRGEGLLLLPLLAVPLVLVHQRGWRVRLSHLAFIGAAAVLVVAPWTVRNAVAFHKLVPVSFNSEEVIRNANCDVTYYGSEVGFWSYACYQPAAPPGYDEAQRAAFWRRNGVAYIRDHADRVPAVVAARVGRVWDLFRPGQNVENSTIEGRDLGVSRLGQLVYYALVPLSAVGLLVLRRRRVPIFPLVAMGVLVTVTAAYAYGVIRFRIPAEVAMVVLSAVAIDAALGRLRRRTSSRRASEGAGEPPPPVLPSPSPDDDGRIPAPAS